MVKQSCQLLASLEQGSLDVPQLGEFSMGTSDAVAVGAVSACTSLGIPWLQKALEVLPGSEFGRKLQC